MMAAIAAHQSNYRVDITIFEHNEEPGKNCYLPETVSAISPTGIF